MNVTGNIAWDRSSVLGRRPSADMPRSYKDLDLRSRENAKVRKKVFACPECHKEFETPEILAVHLERHRPVDGPVYSIRGKLRSILCPEGCGRYFKQQPGRNIHPDTRHHLATCDGSSPLNSYKEHLR